MSDKTPAEDPNAPLPTTNPAPEGSKPPQDDDPVTAKDSANPAY